MTPHSTEAVREEQVTPWTTVAPHSERLAAYKALLSGPAPSALVPRWWAWLRWPRLSEHRA